MRVIKPDFNGRVQIEGISGWVSRPVDIDQVTTGFKSLRTLRIYKFGPGSVVNGHAEEDEVFVVVLRGSIELTLTRKGGSLGPVHLEAAGGASVSPCVGYLPPQGEYRLVARTLADVAYARARPASGPPPLVFQPRPALNASDSTVILDEANYAEILRLRIVEISTLRHELSLAPLRESDQGCEALIHVLHLPDEASSFIRKPGAEPVQVQSRDTLAINPDERPTLHLSEGSSTMLLILTAAGR